MALCHPSELHQPTGQLAMCPNLTLIMVRPTQQVPTFTGTVVFSCVMEEWWLIREEWWLIREKWWLIREEWWLIREEWWLIGNDTRL